MKGECSGSVFYNECPECGAKHSFSIVQKAYGAQQVCSECGAGFWLPDEEPYVEDTYEDERWVEDEEDV